MSSSRFKIKIPPRRCIFCGGKSVSGEHIWPRWSHPLFPVMLGNTVIEAHGRGPHGTGLLAWTRRSRQGRVIQKQVYAACKLCNSGWMNRLETAARPFVTALSRGEPRSFNETHQLTIAHWITLKMMIAEHDIRGMAVFTADQNKAFFNHFTMPDHLQIWLFRCGRGAWISAYSRHSVEAKLTTRDKIEEAIAAPDGPANTQSIAFGFNDLFIYASHTVLPNLQLHLDMGHRFGCRLWPLQGGDIYWPPLLRLGANEAMAVAQTLTRVPRILNANPIILPASRA